MRRSSEEPRQSRLSVMTSQGYFDNSNARDDSRSFLPQSSGDVLSECSLAIPHTLVTGEVDPSTLAHPFPLLVFCRRTTQITNMKLCDTNCLEPRNTSDLLAAAPPKGGVCTFSFCPESCQSSIRLCMGEQTVRLILWVEPPRSSCHLIRESLPPKLDVCSRHIITAIIPFPCVDLFPTSGPGVPSSLNPSLFHTIPSKIQSLADRSLLSSASQTA